MGDTVGQICLAALAFWAGWMWHDNWEAIKALRRPKEQEHE